MSAEPKPNPMAAFQSRWYRFALLFFASYLAVFWFVLGPSNPWYALMIAWGTCSLEPALPVPMIMRRVPRQWFRVPAGERVLHRMVGIGIFGWLLDVSGWNHLIKPMRGFSGKRAGLPSLEQHARAGAVAHGICFAIHVILAALALFSRHPWTGALWMLLPGAVVHLYPVLLQRSMMLRLQPLLEKIAS
ncbi:MAG TPA: hypothetical protein VN519_14140 [Bryobacteraceae bacterium]|nr:hypothetical protein [Bryobacteraceae bacterium]